MKPVLRLLLGAGLVAGLALGVAQLLPRRPAPARVGIAGTTPAPIRVEPAPEPAALRSLLDPATATDTERLAACHALPATLDAAHRATLLRHLDGPCPANCKPAHWHALWNDALNSLRRQGAGADELALFLERNATRPDCDPVIRDYPVFRYWTRKTVKYRLSSPWNPPFCWGVGVENACSPDQVPYQGVAMLLQCGACS